jgi:hypothetical protein
MKQLQRRFVPKHFRNEFFWLYWFLILTSCLEIFAEILYGSKLIELQIRKLNDAFINLV